ncbi:MAG TPA: hypothetical protein DEF41_06975 [Desulfovibrio sp.]|uniref:Uncharacterized protein n=1 Tax=Nitratidesulfovibrio vulgaris (strain ATCC 29579 / DSM 644 / CCUG 34227 / NCIMB 8303 / VKM B-1760 / Hildenborough) TaxID=882 RepID=Q72C47_NITV2|nr:hypothetical protein DVU_1437 [Nitratidesulfovibrio vulgaris str. Hildenborough]HBW15868.1 hypothetical protein [Desulfovibrio sp.]
MTFQCSAIPQGHPVATGALARSRVRIKVRLLP